MTARALETWNKKLYDMRTTDKRYRNTSGKGIRALAVKAAAMVGLALSAVPGLTSCEHGTENVSSGLDDYYYIERMKKLRLAPAYTGNSYRWTMKTADGRDSLLSTEREYIFLAKN